MSDKYKLECKNAVYVKSNNPDIREDGVYASLVKHYEDGRKEKFTKLFKNFTRTIYVTRPDKRDHKQKRAFEEIANCIPYECRQMDMVSTAAKAVGMGFFSGNPRKLWRNPYIYDVDRSITSVFRSRILKKFGEIFTPDSIAVIDIETNVLSEEAYPILVSVTCKDRAYMGILQSYLDGIPGGIEEIEKAIDYYVGDYKKQRNIKIEYFVHKDPGEICKKAIDFLHVIKPDVVTGWGIDYDIPIINDYMTRSGYRVEDVYCDPTLPKEFRHFNYRKGTAEKQKADKKGVMKEKRVAPEERWSVLDCPCPFIFKDAMQVYWILRIAAGKEGGYSLDAVLGRKLGISKLKIEGMKAKSGLSWHAEAQTKFKAAYAAYNLFDVISIELLDEKTKDLSISVPMFGITTDYANFNKQTKRTPDDIAHEFLDVGLVLCAVSDQMKTNYDLALYSKNNWIVTLDAHGMALKGSSNIEEMKNWVTNLYINNSDSDMVGCYPSGQSMANAAPTTRVLEMVKMQGIDEKTQRSLGINVLSGKTGALEVVYKAIPSLVDLDDAVNLFLSST